MAERCIPCEQHAELHKGNWLGIGQEPCAQCEQHAVMHAQESGVGGLCLVVTLTAVAVVGSVLRLGRKGAR
ncbi:hypothetical protein ACQB60_02710 [Actinomycetota bacterium Odt1-20B]